MMTAQPEKIRILLVDDHKIIREGLFHLLNEEQDMTIVGEAENGLEVLEKIPVVHPDLVILDINMPIMNGIECARRITEKYPHIKILVLTMLNEQEHIKSMLQIGVDGYILKNSGKTELLTAIRKIARGENYFSDEVKNSVMMEFIRKKPGTSKIIGDPIPLTPRELDILQLIVEEYTNQEIAEKLYISVRTVDAHRRNLLEKTGARNTAGLVKYAYEHNLVKKRQ